MTEYRKRLMSSRITTEMKRLQDGEEPDLTFEWQREFHMTILPLNSHNHAIGEVVKSILILF